MELETRDLNGIEYCYAFSTLREVLSEFKKQGFRICHLKDIAKLRLLEGKVDGGVIEMTKDHTLTCNDASNFDEGPFLIKEGVLCFPGRPAKARIIKNCLFSTELQGVHYPNEEQIKKALENSIEFPVIRGSSSGIPFKTNSFDEEELMIFLFGGRDKELAGKYGRILNESGIDEIRVYPQFAGFINEHRNPYIQHLTYGREWDSFDIYLHSTFIYPHNNERIYGIKKREGFQKIELPKELVSVSN